MTTVETYSQLNNFLQSSDTLCIITNNIASPAVLTATNSLKTLTSNVFVSLTGTTAPEEPPFVPADIYKDMSNTRYDDRLTPGEYQTELFPGMADFIDENIVAGDKTEEYRLYSSKWSDWGGDIFDQWGFFYIYDVNSGKYYFPLLSPQNQDDGVMSTQTFSAFERTFTIIHGYPTGGVFKFDISVNDSLPFIFGMYGDVGSDSNTMYENLTYSYTKNSANLTLWYLHNWQDGSDDEHFFVYYIPKLVSQNSSKTYNEYYNNNDDHSIMSTSITNGLTVYISKTSDAKQWVASNVVLQS